MEKPGRLSQQTLTMSCDDEPKCRDYTAPCTSLALVGCQSYCHTTTCASSRTPLAKRVLECHCFVTLIPPKCALKIPASSSYVSTTDEAGKRLKANSELPSLDCCGQR